MQGTSAKDRTITVRVPAAMFDTLKRSADTADRSIAAEARRGLRPYVAELDEAAREAEKPVRRA